MTKSRHILQPRRYWTPAELEQLHERYPHVRTEDLARGLGMSMKAVYCKAKSLGLHKTPEYLASPAACRLRRGDKVGAAYRFPKGHEPFNKGVKGWQAGGRARETQFKLGHYPAARWDPDRYAIGALRMNADGYVDIKIRDGSRAWRPFHLWLWEQENGPLPCGHAVVFRDHDRLNIELPNLELVSRPELMRRNTVHNLPQPLKSAIQALGQFKRRIREREDRGPAPSPVCDAAGST